MFGREMNETTYTEIFDETDCDDDGNISPKGQLKSQWIYEVIDFPK